MELRKGYKETEVGLIPSDWKVKHLAECIIKNPDYGINAAAVDYDDTLPTYLRITDISEDGKYICKYRVSVQNNDSNSYYLQEGDIVFARTGASVGKTYLYKKSDGKLVFAGFLIRVKVNLEILNPAYLFYHTQTKRYWSWVAGNSMRSGQPGINSNEYKTLLIPLPKDKAEQTAIATALIGMDNLIAGLEILIEKKKAIKQGAMLELLGPKDGWEEISLFQIADNKKELFDDGDWVEAEHIVEEGIRLIQTGNIGIGFFEEKESRKYINENSFDKLKCKELRVGDLLICRLAEPAGRSCVLPDIGESKIITSVDVTVFRPREEVANRVFLANLFSTKEWFEIVSGLSGGTTHKRISRGSLGKIKIFLPDIVEQNKVALILSGMDDEIQSLLKCLEKYKLLKHGMMQELLTGKTRLI